MKLADWIEKHLQQLRTTYRDARYVDNKEVKLGKNCITEGFLSKEVSVDIEVETVNRSELTEEVPGVMVHFQVLRNRCRKWSDIWVYLKIVEVRERE